MAVPSGLGLLRTVGPRTLNLEWNVLRELTAEDARVANEETRDAHTISPLKRINERHHAAARALASGMTVIEVSLATDLERSYISWLQNNDPAFKALVASYRADVERVFKDMHAEMAGLGVDAVSALRRRLEANEEEFKVGQLLELVRTTADRTGYGPSSKKEVNVNLGLAERLDLARKRVAERTAVRVIEAEIVEAAE